LGITDIIYAEINRYRDRKLEEEEKRKIAYGMIKKILRSYIIGWEIHMASEIHGYYDNEIKTHVDLLNDVLSEIYDMISEDTRKKTLEVAKSMNRCATMPKGIGQENWKRYIECVENSIKEAKNIIDEIERLQHF